MGSVRQVNLTRVALGWWFYHSNRNQTRPLPLNMLEYKNEFSAWDGRSFPPFKATLPLVFFSLSFFFN